MTSDYRDSYVPEDPLGLDNQPVGTFEPKAQALPVPRYELPLNATEKIMINIGNYDKYHDGVSNVEVKFYDENNNLIEQSSHEDPVVRDDLGLYSFLIDGSHLSEPGIFKAVWTWDAQRKSKTFKRTYEVNYFAYFDSPTYYGMSDEQRDIVRSVSARFSDLFDNTLGQSRFNFFEQYQSTFGVERIAQMMVFASGVINNQMVPATSYVVGNTTGRQFPRKWYSVLETATYIELLRHAVRSYVEQPNISGGSDIPYADRRDYIQRWGTVLEETKSSFAAQLSAMKRDHLHLGATSALVSGGLYASISVSATNSMERGRMQNAYVPVVAANLR